MDVEHDISEEKPTRQNTPHPSCFLTIPQLLQAKVDLFADCPKCKRLGVLCEVSDHPQTAQSAPSSVPSSDVASLMKTLIQQDEKRQERQEQFLENLVNAIKSAPPAAKRRKVVENNDVRALTDEEKTDLAEEIIQEQKRKDSLSRVQLLWNL